MKIVNTYTNTKQWSPDTAYAVGDKVRFRDRMYTALAPHTSVAATPPDLNAVNWVVDPPKTTTTTLPKTTPSTASVPSTTPTSTSTTPLAPTMGAPTQPAPVQASSQSNGQRTSTGQSNGQSTGPFSSQQGCCCCPCTQTYTTSTPAVLTVPTVTDPYAYTSRRSRKLRNPFAGLSGSRGAGDVYPAYNARYPTNPGSYPIYDLEPSVAGTGNVGTTLQTTQTYTTTAPLTYNTTAPQTFTSTTPVYTPVTTPVTPSKTQYIPVTTAVPMTTRTLPVTTAVPVTPQVPLVPVSTPKKRRYGSRHKSTTGYSAGGYGAPVYPEY